MAGWQNRLPGFGGLIRISQVTAGIFADLGTRHTPREWLICHLENEVVAALFCRTTAYLFAIYTDYRTLRQLNVHRRSVDENVSKAR